ncbi:hypothetical protein ANO11243_063000 [Dothideomycetidae sp. 11243]|nr:hypothetical protein ANO11243_063000 [fungal sp. No.11243]
MLERDGGDGDGHGDTEAHEAHAWTLGGPAGQGEACLWENGNGKRTGNAWKWKWADASGTHLRRIMSRRLSRRRTAAQHVMHFCAKPLVSHPP